MGVHTGTQTRERRDRERRDRVRKLRRALRIIMPIAGVVQLAVFVAIAIYPWLVIVLVVPNVTALILLDRVDREVIRSGGLSWWRRSHGHITDENL